MSDKKNMLKVKITKLELIMMNEYNRKSLCKI